MDPQYDEMVAEAIDNVWSRMNHRAMSGIYPAQLLYFRRSTEKEYGSLHWVDECDRVDTSGLELVTGESVRSSWTRERVAQFVHSITRRLPLLPYGKGE